MKKIAIFYLTIISLLLSGCSKPIDQASLLINQVTNQEDKILITEDSSHEKEKVPSTQIRELIYLDENQLLFIEEDANKPEKKLLSYNFKTKEIKTLLSAEGLHVSVSSDLNNIFIYSWSSQNSLSYFGGQISTLKESLQLTPSSFDVTNLKVSTPPYWQNNEIFVIKLESKEKKVGEEDEQQYAVFNTKTNSFSIESNKNYQPGLSPSGKKLIYQTDCNHWGCLLSIKNLNGLWSNGTIAEVDGSSQQIWSPNEEYIVYDDGYDGPKENIWLFDFKKDDFTSRRYNLLSGLSSYDIPTDSTSLTQLLGFHISHTIKWLDSETLLLKTDGPHPIYWLYDANLEKFLQISAQIKISDEQSIEDTTISKNLNKVAFIKNYGIQKIGSEESLLFQEVWLANADGSDAQIIYKNYE